MPSARSTTGHRWHAPDGEVYEVCLLGTVALMSDSRRSGGMETEPYSRRGAGLCVRIRYPKADSDRDDLDIRERNLRIRRGNYIRQMA